MADMDFALYWVETCARVLRRKKLASKHSYRVAKVHMFTARLEAAEVLNVRKQNDIKHLRGSARAICRRHFTREYTNIIYRTYIEYCRKQKKKIRKKK